MRNKALRYALRLARECKKRKPLTDADKKHQVLADIRETMRTKE